MPKVVDHETRRNEIRKAALKVMNTGKMTVGKVAEECGVARTSMYIYYRDKEDMKIDIEKNIENIDDRVEKAKYILNNREVTQEQYEKIYEILTEV